MPSQMIYHYTSERKVRWTSLVYPSNRGFVLHDYVYISILINNFRFFFTRVNIVRLFVFSAATMRVGSFLNSPLFNSCVGGDVMGGSGRRRMTRRIPVALHFWFCWNFFFFQPPVLLFMNENIFRTFECFLFVWNGKKVLK